MRRNFAFRALFDEVNDGTAHNAKDGNDRPVLASVAGGLVRLTIFDEVGDDENKLDEISSIWFPDLVGATLRRARLADRGLHPVVALEFDHERLPGGQLRFDVDSHDDERKERTEALMTALIALIGPEIDRA